jgi:ubiquitin-conjugating enzyme E2 variant
MPESHPILDRVALLGFAILWTTATLHGLRGLGPDLDGPTAVVASLVAALGAYLLADLLAGLTHWLADRFFREDTRWIGPLLIAPFREHHTDPGSIARHDFATVSGNSALATAPLAVALRLLPEPANVPALALFVFGNVLTLALFLTNLFHRWAHAPRRPPFVRWLHRTGLILTPERHARHHRGDHDCAYCVTSGWLNPLLDGLGVFPRLERLLRARGRHACETREHEAR